MKKGKRDENMRRPVSWKLVVKLLVNTDAPEDKWRREKRRGSPPTLLLAAGKQVAGILPQRSHALAVDLYILYL